MAYFHFGVVFHVGEEVARDTLLLFGQQNSLSAGNILSLDSQQNIQQRLPFMKKTIYLLHLVEREREKRSA